MSDTILQAGEPAPPFTLASSPGQTVSLAQYRGRPVVLVFYPADWSPVCGDELAVFSRALPLIAEHDAVVLGISVDGVWSHQAFREARHYGFDLLSDFNPRGAVAASYGAFDPTSGQANRALFVIDAQGTIAWSYLSPNAINPGADGVLGALDALTQKTTDQPGGTS